MAVGSVSLQSILRTPHVINVVSRMAAAGNPLQSFYRMGLGATPDKIMPVGMRGFTYDIFDHTRLLAGIRAPEAPPARIRRKAVSVGSGYLLRSYEALSITYEQIANMRPLGSPIGTLDKNGQSYVTKQIAYATERNRNLREWVLSRMFRGAGFGIQMDGDNHYVVESGSGQIQVGFQHPDVNRGACACGDSGADIFPAGEPWSTTTTDIIKHLLHLNRTAERRTGLPITEAWINSLTLGHMINNVPLQNAGGSAFRVWESAEWKDMSTIDGASRRRGLDVRFRGFPWVTFHVYDGVLHAGSAQVDVVPGPSGDTPSSSQVDMVIPNGRVLFTPTPGEWVGFVEGSEHVNKGPNGSAGGPEEVRGFSTWQRLVNDPYGREVLFLDNFFPVPYIPAAWYYATVY